MTIHFLSLLGLLYNVCDKVQQLCDVKFLRWLSMFSVSLWLSCGLTLRIAFTQPLCRSSRGKNDCLQLWYWISSSGPSLLTPPSRLFTFLFFIFRLIVSMTLTLMTPFQGDLKGSWQLFDMHDNVFLERLLDNLSSAFPQWWSDL